MLLQIRWIQWAVGPLFSMAREGSEVPLAIYTPRGLRVRLPLAYAFALMARLYPRVTAFKVLKTTEAIDDLGPALTFAVGVCCFALRLDPLIIGAAVAGANIIAVLINRFGFHVIPGLITLGLLYSYISGFGILLVALILSGLILTGWQGVVAFFLGKLAAKVVTISIEIGFSRSTKRDLGVALTFSERHFLNAYRHHAARLGKNLDLSVTDDELRSENWAETYENLAVEWPQVVARFDEA